MQLKLRKSCYLLSKENLNTFQCSEPISVSKEEGNSQIKSPSELHLQYAPDDFKKEICESKRCTNPMPAFHARGLHQQAGLSQLQRVL